MTVDLFGRERYSILWGNESINTPIQGTAARRRIIYEAYALEKRAVLETEPIEDIARSGVEFFRDLNARSHHGKDAVVIEIPQTWSYGVSMT